MYASSNCEGSLPPRIILERIAFKGCSRINRRPQQLEDGFFDPSDHKAKSFQQTRNPHLQDKNGEHGGSKDTSKGDHHLSTDQGRLDSLDDQRGSNKLSRPESQHQARRQRPLRDTLRPRSTTRLQRNRRLQDTQTRTDEDAIRRMEGSTPVPKRPKTQNTR